MPVVPRVPHLGLGVERVAAEHGMAERDLGEAEQAGALAEGLAGHADDPLDREGADHERFAPLGARRVASVVVEHRPVQGVERFLDVVLLGDGQAGAVLEELAGLELLEVEAGPLAEASRVDDDVRREGAFAQDSSVGSCQVRTPLACLVHSEGGR